MTATPTAIDTTRPNAARIYDALLGGYHNFEADRVAAERIMQVAPRMPVWARLNRCYLQAVTAQLAQSGLTHFVDLATGLPTQGYIHEQLPEARVVYSDIDPLTVTYANEILAGKTNVRYVSGDAASPDGLLNSRELRDLFGEERRVGIFCVGVAYFLPDEQLSQALDALYRWAAPGSALALSMITVPPGDLTPEGQALQEQYRRMGVNIIFRTLDRVRQLTGRWSLGEHGWRFLHQWPGVEADDMFDPAELEDGGMHCAVLWKH
jgi:O-methyltransferase involved in polyketide biosynthesis